MSRQQRSSEELFAGSLGRGDDFVEAWVTAEIVPAWIETKIAVRRRIAGKRCDCLELLERTVALTGPCVYQRQIGNGKRTVERVLGNGQELYCKLRQGVVAKRRNAFRGAPVGLIDWLGDGTCTVSAHLSDHASEILLADAFCLWLRTEQVLF
jgi:hypothetical protein